MPPKIQDELADRDISPQLKYQLRHKQDGLCIYCREKAVLKGVCLKHAIAQRERQRKHKKCVRRNNSATYRLIEAKQDLNNGHTTD